VTSVLTKAEVSPSAGRPLGTSLWAVAASWMAAPLSERLAFLAAAEQEAMGLLELTSECTEDATLEVSLSSEPVSALGKAVRALHLVRALSCEWAGHGWAQRQIHVQLGSSTAAQPSVGDDSTPEHISEPFSGVHTAAEVGERCARALLFLQSASRLARTQSPSGGSPGGHARSALTAAAWLMSAAELEDVQISPAEIRRAREHLTGTAASGIATLHQLPSASPCPLCSDPVPVTASSTTQRCANGHELQRCWVCLELLALQHWSCGTCGAGSCANHEEHVAVGTLDSCVPSGACGLCGSACLPPGATLL
jgi:hypothetical protein